MEQLQPAHAICEDCLQHLRLWVRGLFVRDAILCSSTHQRRHNHGCREFGLQANHEWQLLQSQDGHFRSNVESHQPGACHRSEQHLQGYRYEAVDSVIHSFLRSKLLPFRYIASVKYSNLNLDIADETWNCLPRKSSGYIRLGTVSPQVFSFDRYPNLRVNLRRVRPFPTSWPCAQHLSPCVLTHSSRAKCVPIIDSGLDVASTKKEERNNSPSATLFTCLLLKLLPHFP